MKIKIVTDSSANMNDLDGIDFESVPMRIITDEEEYVDDAVLDVEQMVDDLSVYKGRSGSACPGVGAWLAAFEDYDEIYCVTIISTLSGSYNAAMVAKKQYEEENPGKKVFVLDSYSVGPEMRLHIEKIRELIQEGKDFATITKEIQAYKEANTSLIFSLESLHNLANNGRVKPAVAKIAGMLGIRVIGNASEDGQLNPTDKCRGEKKALVTMVRNMKQKGYIGGKMIIDHCCNEKAANYLRDLVKNEFENAKVVVERTRALCSFYAERGGLIVGYEVNKTAEA